MINKIMIVFWIMVGFLLLGRGFCGFDPVLIFAGIGCLVVSAVLKEMRCMIMHKLQEMDVVLRRDGVVCMVLKDDIVGKLRLFGLDLLGYHLLKDYTYDGKYGKDIVMEDLDEKELENIRKYDIVAVSGLDSTFRKLLVIKNYKQSRDVMDVETINVWFKSFLWVYTDAFYE